MDVFKQIAEELREEEIMRRAKETYNLRYDSYMLTEKEIKAVNNDASGRLDTGSN